MSKGNTQPAATLLVAGAIVGILLASTGVLESNPNTPAKEVLAQVNNERIDKAEYLAYLDLLARDKRNAMTSADRRHLLDRLIEEKLLLQRAVEIGVPFSDPTVRKTIINAMIATVTSDSASAAVDTEQLMRFYQQNQTYFAQPMRAQVRRMVFRGEQAQARSSAAEQALLNGQDWQRVQHKMADTDILALPSSPLPVSKLRGYLGPTLADAALELAPGAISAPLTEQAGFTILQLIDLQAGPAPPLAQVEERVLREYQRRAADQALRDYLNDLRGGADVSIDEAFLEQLDRLDATIE
ncbi:peptidyl-prolyl cis-trans isomerase [Candidatus Litorirhabdus singularis]|nr:peptidyl-prolyl cis-trans isomerase [Candidatus Litorirhabdus singularis]